MNDSPHNTDGASDGLSAEEKRADQLTAAPKASASDAEPRIEVTPTADGKRVDIRDDAEVRPGSAG